MGRNRTLTEKQIDEMDAENEANHEEMNRQKGLDEELAALTPELAVGEYRRLTNQDVAE